MRLIGMTLQASKTDNAADSRRERFVSMADEYAAVIAKVCSVYASASAPFADLYQEVMVNLWTGLETYRGESQVSTWIYRLAINTCITWHRRNRRHTSGAVSLDGCPEIADMSPDTASECRELYELIGRLEPFDKALVTLWLDERSYDEIAAVLGISKANVATRLHRVKAKLTRLANQ
ncbi:MAG: sigma-70 family RNA polymerase sigma factor [Bacteroidales bacterium]|nr:sigma-70 family RNA polymerase sigma factor [Bacteroidales bacterium]